MPGGLGGVGQMAEEEELKVEHKISQVITEMDPEIKDRFKALKSI